MSANLVHVVKEYRGLPAPQSIPIPTIATGSELVELCTEEHPRHYNLGLAYPPKVETPVFWIKYGTSVIWDEAPAQVMAYKELRRLSSPVKIPGIFYACEVRHKGYIVMEYIPGKTAGECLEGIKDPAGVDSVYSSIAFALSELYLIPIPPGSRSAAIDGGKIRHALFDDQVAPRHYQSVAQLEDHLNLVGATGRSFDCSSP